jgi:hypothetical protein
VLGEGASRKHPELIAAYMQTAAMDFAGGIVAQQIRAGLDNIAKKITDGIDNLAGAL